MRDEGSGSQAPDTGTRRLCMALASERPGLLAEACQGGRFGRLFLAVLADGTQVAIAPSGIEEVRLVRDLVDAVTVLVPAAPDPGGPPTRPMSLTSPMSPTLLALNVGIMRVLDDGFTGAGLERARSLANDAAVRTAVGEHVGAGGEKRGGLAVVLSAGLYADLYDEGYALEDWHPVRASARVVPVEGIVNDLPEYRSVVAVDIEKSSGRGNQALLTIREALKRCLSESVERSGIVWDACLVEDLGDGLRVTVPAGTARTSLIHPLIPEVVARLREHNRLHAAPGRIRVRMAMHSGDVFIGSSGVPAGSSLIVLARMLDSRACRDALAKAPQSAPLALLVSQHFYDETIAHGYVGIETDEFRRVEVEEREYTAGAWLYVPGVRDANDESSPPAPSLPAVSLPAASSGNSSMTVIANDSAKAVGVQHGDVHIHHL